MKVEIEEQELASLREHSRMLGCIASLVFDWCCEPECTTLSGVKRMKADLLRAQADKLEQDADDQVNNARVP